jgi:trimeric autotransporter adhesin
MRLSPAVFNVLPAWRSAWVRRLLPLLLLLALLLPLAPSAAYAAAPAAGTAIGNQASATYTDATNTQRTVTSNIVVAIVQQVASVSLAQNASRTVSIGSQVSYPLTLTNTGNGPDSFVLSGVQGGAFNFTSAVFYADANGDGVPDNTTPITNTGTLVQDGVFKFVAVGVVPNTAVSGNTNAWVVTATSALNGAINAAVTETTTVTSNAVIAVTKAMSSASGLPGSGPYTVTLTYSNSGNTAATAFVLRDPLPAGLVYVPNSGRWAATGSTVLTDSNSADAQGAGPTVTYDYGVTAANQVTAVISAVQPGQTGSLTFQVMAAAYDSVTAIGQAAGAVPNTANHSYYDGAATIGPVNSNTFSFAVLPVVASTMVGQTVPNAAQGSTVTFANVVRNTGNSTDSFDITFSANTFPVGSSVVLYQADGVTPLLDTNGNNVPDTGPLASGASTTVVLRVTLPPAASGGPFSVTKTATSKLDPTRASSATDTLTLVIASGVDLTNNAALAGVGVVGVGAGAEATAQVTNSTNPGTTTRFTLVINNTSPVADTYNLAASTNASFGTLVLPTGWSVVFKDASGAVVTNTGSVAAGGNRVVYADVTLPANQPAITAPGQAVYFRALSPTTGAVDRIFDAVVVNTVRSLQITPDHTGQVFAGASVVYAHLLTNTGNVQENAGSAVALTLANSGAGFNSVVVRDANGNGLIDATDPVVNTAADPGPIAPGATVRLLVKVTAAPGAALGTTDTNVLTVTTTGLINGVAVPVVVKATNTTTVISGNLVLLKEQALDANCDGTPDAAYSAANLSTGAVPGACLRYRITLTNVGTANVVGVVLSDAMPAATTYHATVAASATQGTVTAPAPGATGTVSAAVGTLAPGASATLSFGVRINP